MNQTTAIEVELPKAMSFLLDPPLGGIRYRVAYGGRGSAKSWSFARVLLLHGMQRPLRILCAREYQVSIKDSVHQLLSDQVDAMGLSSFYDVQTSVIAGLNGTDFLFKGLRRNIQEIKSTEGIDLCWVEEAEAVSDNSWRILIPTVRKSDSEIWVSFNPALASDPTYRRFVQDPPSRSIVQFVSWKDNPWLPEVLKDEAEELRIKDPEAYAHVWGGEPWQRSDAQVLAGKWTVEEFEPRDSWNGPYYGADWGFALDPTIIARVWIADSRLYIDYDNGAPQMNLDDIEREWSKVPGAKQHTIRADSARPETINEMASRGWKIVGAKKWSGSVEDGIEHLRSYEKIVIHPRCKRAREEARLWSYKTDPRTDDVIPKLKDGFEHVWDAVRYALAPIIQKGRGFAFG